MRTLTNEELEKVSGGTQPVPAPGNRWGQDKCARLDSWLEKKGEGAEPPKGLIVEDCPE